MPKSWLVRGAEAADRARRRMQRLGITPNGYPLWERWEVEPVVGRYPDYRSIFPELDRRTHAAVYNKAGRLGITKSCAKPWSDNEILRLRKVYPSGTHAELMAVFPGRSLAAIKKMANSRKIYRAPKLLVPTGYRLLDQVLSRARALNLSRLDLDKMARSKRYFQSSAWKRAANEVIHCRAAMSLGGTIRVAFP